MQNDIKRIHLRLNPDYKKVIPRFFNPGDKRSKKVIIKVLEIPEAEVKQILDGILAEFAGRHKNIKDIFTRHFDLIVYLLPANMHGLMTRERMLLLGAYFTMEYSFESAALFNPSIVEAPDQTGAGEGEKNVIISFRATGESHISSIIFKRGKLLANGEINLEDDGKFMTTGKVTQKKPDNKILFEEALTYVELSKDIRENILEQLHEPFTYKEIELIVTNVLSVIASVIERTNIKYKILHLVNTNYELHFPSDSLISERVIFPFTYTEKNGIEDARFVKFTNEDGSSVYIATYTAYDGLTIRPQLIKTKDFCHFNMSALHGKTAINKNLALFPRKINGHYVMLSRVDGENNYIMFSEDLHYWENAELIQEPEYSWELIQIGNAGSPIETSAGWLVITHGVGPMRKYSLGAALYDLENPAILIGKLKEPLLVPNEEERHGYVPNVVYSCGSIIHNDILFIPYAVSDYASGFATISLNVLISEMLKENN
jgi:predicted GH43/DUF377 family glycosyl hydrolase